MTFHGLTIIIASPGDTVTADNGDTAKMKEGVALFSGRKVYLTPAMEKALKRKLEGDHG